jgi:F-type H+-transporting ATPase subunit epsilon
MSNAFTDKTFQFELVSPEQVLASEQASMVLIPGEAGDFGVLADHAPLLSSLRMGIVEVQTAAGQTDKFFVAGGFADVGGALCSVLAEDAVNLNDLDRATLEASLKTLQDALEYPDDDTLKKTRIARDIEITRAKLIALAG